MKTTTSTKEWTTGNAMRYFLKLLKHDSEHFEVPQKNVRKNWRALKKEIK